ncbi:CYP63 [Symbiodinium sp. CCMP2592]|nr:CYP63 [Symbiodinium sp. CCMP2592]
MTSKAFLDVDIDGELAAFKLGQAFVEANDIKYSLSSKDVLALGGSELSRLPELFESDYEWSQKGRALFKPPQQRVVIELFDKESPMACANFKAFCTGEKGKSKESGKEMCYRNVPFHRVIKGFMMQGGDFVTGTGAGGESIYGKKFKDDAGGLKLKHDARGIVSMSNTGKNSNTCQFFITFGELKQLNGKHVVIGRVVEGMEVIDRTEVEAGTEKEDKPQLPVVIVDCGLVS